MIGEKAAVAQKGGSVDLTSSAYTVGRGVVSGLYIGGSGDLVVKFEVGGPDVTFVAHPAGYAPINVYSIEQATAATDIVVLW